MLQQILDDMHVDPDILEALNDEQKKILFLKMREEQVRRWKEREENEDREGRPERPRPKKASYKKVSWLLGCDGDVHVCIIGEEEEPKSPKHVLSELRGQNGTNLSKAIRFQTTEPLRSSPNNQKDQVESGKSGIELLLEKTKINHPDPIKEGGDENLRLYKDESDSSHSSDSIVSCNNDLRSDESVRTSRGFSIAERLNQRVLQRSNKEQLNLRETPCSQTVHAPEKEVLNDQEMNYSHGGRVAQLRRNFNAPNAKTSVPCVKPPIPTKPTHLLTAASVR